MAKSVQVLVLEPEPQLAAAVAAELARAGTPFEARTVAAPEDLASVLREFKPDLILANPPGTGSPRGLLLRVRGHCPDASVVLILDQGAEEAGLDAIRLGAADFVTREHLQPLRRALVRAAREGEERRQRRKAETMAEFRCQQLRLQNEALQESEARFRQLAESIQDVFWLRGPDRTRFLYVSPAYEQVWGRSREGLYADPAQWSMALHPDDRSRFLGAAFLNPDSEEFEQQYRVLHPDGTLRWVHDRAYPVRDETGAVRGLAGVAVDVTMRKRLEQQILEIGDREQARIGQDLHDDLCQLLVSIGFNVNSLKQDAEGQPGLTTAAERIARKVSDAIKRARHIAQGLCPLDLEREDLAGALENLARHQAEDHKISCTAACAAATRITDPAAANHIYRIASEAVHNATKHARPKRISIQLTQEGSCFRLLVADDGIGIPAQVVIGAGMGLEIMKHRASVLRGNLAVRRRPDNEGGGTLVDCAFPSPVIP